MLLWRGAVDVSMKSDSQSSLAGVQIHLLENVFKQGSHI